MKKIIPLFTVLAMASAQLVQAQEWGIELNGGLQGLQYNVNGGDNQLQAGGSLGLQRSFPLGQHWNLLTGVQAGYYANKVTLKDGTVMSTDMVDDVNTAFRYRVGVSGYEEKQNFLAFSIPLMLQYHTSGKTQWYINGGGKLFLPLNMDITAKADQLRLSGYYPAYDVEFTDLPQHGFGKVNNWNSNVSSNLNVAAVLSAATGLSFQLSQTMRLYTGVYVDYGLTPMSDANHQASLVSYNPTSLDVHANGVMNTPAADDARLLAYGVQVRLGFGRRKATVAPVKSGRVVAQPTITEATPPVTETAPGAQEPKLVEQPVVVEPVAQPTPKPEQPAPVIATKPTVREEQVIEKPVVFGVLGKTAVPEGLKPRLDSISTIMKLYPDVRVAIIGHTCSIGTERENIRVGRKRALAVAAYLEKKGISRSRMDISSQGESKPLHPNTSDANRRQNRNVTIIVEE